MELFNNGVNSRNGSAGLDTTRLSSRHSACGDTIRSNTSLGVRVGPMGQYRGPVPLLLKYVHQRGILFNIRSTLRCCLCACNKCGEWIHAAVFVFATKK